jgi:Pentapeptide repeats (8 copies)/DinB superfamily
MVEFIRADLRGSRFERVDLSGAQLRAVDLTDARFRGVDLSRVTMRGVELINVDIHGEIENVTINGVDIGPLVNAELDSRFPDRAKMRPTDPAGFREAWDILERLWGETIERARRLRPELLHESVDDEWSFIETLRHLVFATDSWIRRAILGDPSPWDPLTCRGTRCPIRRACLATATHDPRSRQCSSCTETGCPPCAWSSRV